MEFVAKFHPIIIHFAISFLIIYGVLEVVGAVSKRDFFKKAAHLFLLFGVIAATGSVISGDQAKDVFDNWNKVSSDIIEMHETYASITIWFFSALLLLRSWVVLKKYYNTKVSYVFAVLSLVGMFFIFKTGEMGGKLVFEHGVGTNIIKEPNNSNSTPENKNYDGDDHKDSHK